MAHAESNYETREVTVKGTIKVLLQAHRGKLKTKPWRVNQPVREGEASVIGRGRTADEAFRDWVENANFV
jgi:hypothetical protein